MQSSSYYFSHKGKPSLCSGIARDCLRTRRGALPAADCRDPRLCTPGTAFSEGCQF